MRRRILFIAPFPPPVTGAAMMADVLAAAIERTRLADLSRLDISMPNLSGSFREYVRKFFKLASAATRLLATRHDLLIISPPGGVMLVAYLPAMIAARIRGAKILLDHHNYACINKYSFPMVMASKLMGRDGTHLFLSRKMANEWQRKYSAQSVMYCSNWGRIDFDTNHKANVDGAPLTLGFLSNVTLDKGINAFIELVEFARSQGAIVQALIGGGIDAAANSVIENARLRGVDFEIWGPVFDDEKRAFLERCDILVLPTEYRNEAEPLVLIEGQLAGCYVLATDIGTISESVCSANGAVLPPRQFVDLALEHVLKYALEPSRLRSQRASIIARSIERSDHSRGGWAGVVMDIVS